MKVGIAVSHIFALAATALKFLKCSGVIQMEQLRTTIGDDRG